MEQPKVIIVDDDIQLIKYYPYYKETIKWYQDYQLCKQVDNIDFLYDKKRLSAMYRFLSQKGECYYIKYQHRLVGDISICQGTIGMVVKKEFQNKHIGRKSVIAILQRAQEIGLKNVDIEVYDFNAQCKKMINDIGFYPISFEHYRFDLPTITFPAEIDEDKISFAVIVSKYCGKYVFCKHKQRNTYEIPGGHREINETVLECAKRELVEETGAKKFSIKEVTNYAVDNTYGRIYYAEIDELDENLHFEIESIKLFDQSPYQLTYPFIQPIIFKEVKKMEVKTNGKNN